MNTPYSPLLLLATVLLQLIAPVGAVHGQESNGASRAINSSDLLAPAGNLPMALQSSGRTQATAAVGGWKVSGRAPAQIVFQPAEGSAWDASKWTYARLEIKNEGPGVVTVEGLLENSDAKSWENACPGFAVIRSGQTGTLGFAFPRPDSEFLGPDVFRSQLAKPNGHRVHWQLHSWGINTLAAWSDEAMMRDGKTPYTLIAPISWPIYKSDHERIPSPFHPAFAANVRKMLEKFAWAKNDPFCLGVFVDNELSWPDKLTPSVFKMPAWEPTRKWVLEILQDKYQDVGALNDAWGTQLARWDDFLKLSDSEMPSQAEEDIEPLYFDYAQAYFSKTAAAIHDVLPNKLYLGCRTHRGPNLLGRAAQGSVDLFSVNCYSARASAHQVARTTDMPILVAEFHFGACDRGVPSPGLSSAHDQTQRGLAFANYLATAMSDPRFVGVHWFRWLDQSAAGRKDRENHQCGFVDVTGQAYPEFVQSVQQATTAMYPVGASGERSPEKILEALIARPDRDVQQRHGLPAAKQ